METRRTRRGTRGEHTVVQPCRKSSAQRRYRRDVNCRGSGCTRPGEGNTEWGVGGTEPRRRRRCERRPVASSLSVTLVVAVGVVAAGVPLVQGTSTGISHTCAILKPSANIKCWGDNSEGQLGLNQNVVYGIKVTDMGDNLPTVPLGSEFVAVAIASGKYHNCAISDDGKLKCWGRNDNGQLGLGHTQSRGQNTSTFDMGDKLDFVKLGSDESVESVALGMSHTCAVLSSGSLKCWGLNDVGQLGLGDNVERGSQEGQMGDDLPAVDVGNYTVTAVALGNKHTCALLDGGVVKCWGNNNGGQLGYEDRIELGVQPFHMGDNLTAVDLGWDQRALAIDTGAFHSCALLNTGRLKCWGWNQDGQLGQLGPAGDGSIGSSTGSMGDDLAPIELGENRTVTAVACGAAHTCAVLDDASLKCWGAGDDGVTGHGDNVTSGLDPSFMGDNLPTVNLTFGRGVGQVNNVFAGTYHTCVSGVSGGIACFGSNDKGQLGVGSKENQGDDPGETQKLQSIFLAKNQTVAAPDAPAGDFVVETISPTAAPVITPAPASTPPPSSVYPSTASSMVVLDTGVPSMAPPLVTRMPVHGDAPTVMPSGRPATAVTSSGDSGSGSAARTAVIVCAAIFAPILFVSLFWCYRRRRRQQRELKGMENAGSAAANAAIGDGTREISHQFTCETSGDSCERSMGPTLEGTPETLAQKPLVQGFSGQSNSSVPDPDSASDDVEAMLHAKDIAPHAKVVAAPVSAVPVATLLSGDDDDPEASGNWERLGETSPRSSSHASDLENPGELRRRGMSRSSSGSSFSTLGSTSTTSTAWTNDPFNTPARTDIPRGSGGLRYGNGRGRGHAVVGSGGSEDSETRRTRATAMVGMGTPASLAAATPGRLVPETPSPRSTISAVGTPHPPEVRLAHFARAGTSENYLYGVPELDNGRTTGSVLDSNKDNGMEGAWRGPGGRSHYRDVSASGMSTTSTPSANAGDGSMASGSATTGAGTGGASLSAGLAAGTGVGGTPIELSNSTALGYGINGNGTCASSASSSSPFGGTGGSGSSPTEVALITPDRRRNGSGGSMTQSGLVAGVGGVIFGPGNVNDMGSRRKSGSRSSRSRASAEASSPAATDNSEVGGMAEWNARSFAEEAELEALQIDKNDLKLVFGRPFARGKTSEVYQVTHEGKNRAAKIIDLFLQGVVGNEVNRLYSCFAQELRVMKGIRHNCVSAVYGAVATPSELTIVTDLVKRGPLRTVLDDKSKKESLTPDVRHKILKDIARGMAYLTEQGVQHRNLHSHNVLITNSWGAKVADYGLWRTMEVLMCADGSGSAGPANGSSKRKASWRSATLRWTAPELIVPPADGSDPYTTASDVYSMGVMAWELLCGGPKLPYDGVSNEKVKSMILEGSTPSIPMETPIVYAKLILQCWRKNATLRPTFAHIAEVLLNDPPPKPI